MKHLSIPFTLAMLFGLLVLAAPARAQDMKTPTDLADAKPGECYAQVFCHYAAGQCHSAPQYDTRTKRVLKQEASFRLEDVPAVYENVTERVPVEEESERLEIIPAVYENVTERVIIKEAGTRIETMPAVYETATERVLVKPARTVWKNSSGTIYGTAVRDDEGKLITRPSGTGEVLCLVEEPAEYNTVTKRVLKTPATSREIEVPAEYKTVTKRVMKKPPEVRKIAIPAKYNTVTKRVLKTPATSRRIEIPEEYETVTERVMVSEAKMEWVPVLCDVNVTQATVREIQNALRRTGHYSGSVDGVFGSQTNTAIASFQRAKNLPQGYGLTLATLEALGVNR